MITNTDTLTMIQKIYHLMSADEQAQADKVISGEWYNSEPYKATEAKYQDMGRMDVYMPLLIGETIRALKQDIKQTESGKPRSSGKKSVVNAMLKKAAGEYQDWKKYTLVENDRQYYLDGTIGFSFVEVDNSFPICPDDQKANYFPLEKRLLEPMRINHGDELELPSYKLLEAYYKQNKNKYSRVTFCFGENQPMVDVERLLKVMKALPTVKLYMDKPLTPIYGIDEDGNEVILMPVRNDNPTSGRTQI